MRPPLPAPAENRHNPRAYCASLIFARTHRALAGAGLVELQDKLPEEQ